MSTIYINNNHPYCEPDTLCDCDNCGTVSHLADLNAIHDAEQRLTPGEETPAGECPGCGALAFIIKPEPVPENPIKEDFTGDNDRRLPEASKGMEARPVGERVRYLAARAKLIDLIVEARIDETEDHEMKDLASHLIEQRCIRDSDKSLLEEMDFMEIKDHGGTYRKLLS
jgi:hypothetical protein